MSFVEMKQNNNIRPEGTPCLLIHGFDAEQIIIIKGLAMTLDIIDVRVVETSMQDNCIQDIIDNNIKRNAMVKPISEQVIIFNDLSEHDIHKFIGDFKKTDICCRNTYFKNVDFQSMARRVNGRKSSNS
jgi:hypothetical protein